MDLIITQFASPQFESLTDSHPADRCVQETRSKTNGDLSSLNMGQSQVPFKFLVDGERQILGMAHAVGSAGDRNRRRSLRSAGIMVDDTTTSPAATTKVGCQRENSGENQSINKSPLALRRRAGLDAHLRHKQNECNKQQNAKAQQNHRQPDPR